MPAERILITGAAGFAGSYLIERLGRAQPIVGWFKPGTPPPPETPGVEWMPVELVDREAVDAAVAAAAPTQIYHLAGAPSVETSWVNAVPHLETNALGTHYLLRAVERARRRCRVLVVTSAQVYQIGDAPIREDAPLVPSSPYGLTKLAQDQLALQAASDGLDVVIARPFNHIGPRQTPGFAVASFARQVARIEAGLEPAVMRVGNLDTRRDMTDVRDVADAYVRIVHAGLAGRPYNVCSGRPRRMRDLLERLRQMAAVDITIETDPARLRPNDVPVVEGDATRLRTELGWAPRIDLDDTLRETLDWWRADVRAGG